jgi:hypothetical protein
MRMALCWIYKLLVFLFPLLANATISLSPDLTKFIPDCAQQCFKSYLDSNYPGTICGDTPTLDCLCSSNSISGYTVGEGAVQCIVSEDRIGFCTGDDAQGMLPPERMRNILLTRNRNSGSQCVSDV